MECLEEMEWGYSNVRGLVLPRPTVSQTDTILHYADHRREKRERKGKEKGEEEITKEVDVKQAFFPNYQPEYEGNGYGPLNPQRNSCLGKP